MMTTYPCPSREQIRDFLLGQTSSATDLSSHLDECRECSRVADELDADSDSVIANLRIKLDGYDCEPVDLSGNQLGDYQLIRRIGAGGMGTVYQALHSHLKKLVAIKILPQGPAVSKGALPRFRLEMEAAARVDHAHVVRAMDAREIDGRHFLVMEHVEGIDLSRLVKSIGPLSVIDACEIVRQAALGIDSIHAVGMVHRDIKPSNLILSTAGIVKVVDLGLAFLQTSDASAIEYDESFETDLSPMDDASMSRLTRTGHRLGTAKYVAPEQAQGSADVDHRADIFSLGCTLFYLLTGDVPYVEPWDQDAKGVAKGPSVRKLRKDVPTSLDDLVSKMIAPVLNNRCGHAREVADSLESIILDEEAPVASPIASLRDEPALAGLAKLNQRASERLRSDRKRRQRRRYVIACSSLMLLVAFVAATMLPAKFKATESVEVEPLPELVEETRSPISVVTLPMTPEELAGLVAVKFSPDLARLLAVYSDTARIWDTNTGKQLYDGALPGQEPPTTSHLAYDVAGQRLLDLTTAEQRELNTQLLKEAGVSTEPTESSSSPRTSTAVTKHWESIITSASSSRYAVKVDANKVLFFDVSKRINKLVDVSISPIRHLELSGDGRIVAIGGEETLALWDFDTQTRLREDNVGALKGATLSHDGSVIARISDDGKLVVHDLTNELLAKPFSDADVDVADFAWNARVLAYGDQTGIVALWNCDLFEFFIDYDLETADDEVLLSIAFSQDGTELAAASSLGKVYHITIDLSAIAPESELDVQTTRLELMTTLSGHESRVTSVAFSQDGTKLAAGGDDRSIRIFDVASGELDSTHLVHNSFVRSIKFLPDQPVLVSASEDGTVKGFDWPEMTERFKLAIPGCPTILATLQERGRVAVGTTEGEVFIVSAEPESDVLQLDTSKVTSTELALCTLETGEVIVGDQIEQLSIHQGSTGELLRSHMVPHHALTSLTVSPDQQFLVAGTLSGKIAVLRWRMAEQTASWLAHPTPVNAVKFSHNGDYIASACRNGELKLWSSKTFRIQAAARAHEDTIRDLQFSPDDRLIATASHDGTVRLWQVFHDE